MKYLAQTLLLSALSLGGHALLAKTTVSTDQLLNQLSLKQKVSQLFIVGFAGTEYNQSMGPRIRSQQPGSVIVFKRNIANPLQIAKMNRLAQIESVGLNKLPLFIMVDQEGGSVTRIKTTPPAPSALALGMTEDPELIYKVGHITGQILDLLGFNMNLAPVVDLSNPEERNFIGSRSFGNDPERVSKYASAFSRGLIAAGILPTAKHFPGHGGIVQDSHKGFTRKMSTLKKLMKSDLMPFRHLSKEGGLSAIMVAHVAFPEIDPSGLPATFSKVLITDMLRDTLGYNGLVMTDDLEMLGASSVGGVGERAVLAIQAGVDMVMVAWSRKKQIEAMNAVYNAVLSGRISEDRINDSVRRIINTKLKLKRELDLTPIENESTVKRLQAYFGELKILTHRVTKKNFDSNRPEYSQLNQRKFEMAPVFIFSAYRDFYKSFRGSFRGPVKYIPISRKYKGDITYRLQKNPSSVGVYYASGTISASWLNQLPLNIRSRLIVVNASYPGIIANESQFRAVIHLHTRNEQAGRLVAEFIQPQKDIKPGLRKPAKDSKAEQARTRLHRREARNAR